MEITITQKTEIIDGKGYPLTTTRILGLQQIQRHGEPMWVTAITYHDSREGCTSAFRLYKGPIPPEGEVQNRLPPSAEARVKEIAAQGMWRKGEGDP
ncbi:MAG: hypothetical protein HFG05_04330 [Oscillibacter sp.]|nr:hypothetical protein [Oscillibacter sp.]